MLQQTQQATYFFEREQAIGRDESELALTPRRDANASKTSASEPPRCRTRTVASEKHRANICGRRTPSPIRCPRGLMRRALV